MISLLLFQVRSLRLLFVLVYVGIYVMTIAALATEQTVSTTNGKDPHPFVYFRLVDLRECNTPAMLYCTVLYQLSVTYWNLHS